MLSLPSLSAAADAVPGYIANVQVAVRVQYEMPDTFVRDGSGEFILEDGEPIPAKTNSYVTDEGLTVQTENLRSVKSFKFGNREILELMLENDDLPEGEESIKGWSLKAVSDGMSTIYYAYKKGKTPVTASPLGNVSYSTTVGKSTLRTKVKLAEPKGAVTSTRATGAATSYSSLDVSVSGDNFGGWLKGKVVVGTKNVFPADRQTPVLIRTMKASHLCGQGGSAMGDIFLEGSFSVTGGVLVEDLTEEFAAFGNAG